MGIRTRPTPRIGWCGMSKRKRRRYDDKFRAGAVIMLESQGYPEVKGALQAVSDHLDVPHSTLHNWYHAKHNPPPSDVRQEIKLDLVQALRNEIAAALGTIDQKRDEATYRELATAIAIFIDKLQLLEAKPTAISEQRHHVQLTVAQRTQRVTELLDTARTRRDGPSADGPGDSVVH